MVHPSTSSAIACPTPSRCGRFLILLCSFCAGVRAHPQAPPCPSSPSHISIQRGSFSSQPDVTFELRHFVATLVPRSAEAPLCYQKTTVVSHADIFVSNQSLTQVFAGKLGQTDSKIKGLQIENGLDKVSLRGEIVKLIPLKFSVEGPVTTDGNALLLHATKIDADGIPIKALLEIIGDHLSSVMNFQRMEGITVEGDTMAFYPEQIAHLKGHITSVESSPEGLTLHYSRPPKAVASNHPDSKTLQNRSAGDENSGQH